MRNSSAGGEVKIPGGKFVRVQLCEEYGAELSEAQHGGEGCLTAHLDGDFFLDDESIDLAQIDTVLARSVRELVHGMSASASGSHASARNTTAGIRSWLHTTERQLNGLIDAHMIGASAEAIALATLRACVSAGMVDESLAHEVEELRAQNLHRFSVRATESVPVAAQLMDYTDIRRRWQALAPELVLDTPRSAREQMRIEDEWAIQVARGERHATLRIWQWAERAIVCGKFQSIQDEVNMAQAAHHGLTVVRRASGGGAMVIVPEHTITYSLYAPAAFYEGLSVPAAFQCADMWVIDALQSCGVPAHCEGLNDIATTGGKIGGAARVHVAGTPGCILHHTTLAYDIDPQLMEAVLLPNAEKLADKAVRSKARRVSPIARYTHCTRDEVLEAMCATARQYARGLAV